MNLNDKSIENRSRTLREVRWLGGAAVFATLALVAHAQTVTATIVVGNSPVTASLNPMMNKVYIANGLSNNVTVIDGATNRATTVEGVLNPGSVAVNPATNKFYADNADGNGGTVIDGATNGTTVRSSLAVNPVTNQICIANHGSTFVTVLDGAQAQPFPLTTSITPLTYNQTNDPIPSFTFSAQSTTATVPDGVYFQVVHLYRKLPPKSGSVG